MVHYFVKHTNVCDFSMTLMFLPLLYTVHTEADAGRES